MLIILVLSAFFSGCETAFFNLTSRQIRQMKMSRNHLTRLAGSVTNRPGELLNCLLFGNMFVNVLYFALASVVTIRIQQQFGTRAAAVTAFLFFLHTRTDSGYRHSQ